MNDLSISERQELGQLEAVIETGLPTFYEVGIALTEIKEKRLYRQQYGTFEEYCRQRWNFGHYRARTLIQEAETMRNLETQPFVRVLPQNEAQVRALSVLPAEQQPDAWQQVVDTAPNGNITRAHVKAVVDEIRGKTAPLAVSLPEPDPAAPLATDHAGSSNGSSPFNYKRDAKSSRIANEYVPQGYDACQTPAYAIDPLVPYLDQHQTLWEPACGEGLLAQAFCKRGFQNVVGSDILSGQNFFEYEPPEWHCLVTNPPFSLKYRWLERCYALGKPFALLLPVETLGAKTAQDLLKVHGCEILLLNHRINFKMPTKGWEGAAQFPVFWLCWKLLPQPIVFGSIRYPDKGEL